MPKREKPDVIWVPKPIKRGGRPPYEVARGIVEGFCLQEPIPDCAERVGSSIKTVRAIYRELRSRLVRPEFARWHPVVEQHVNLKAQQKQEAEQKEQYALLGKCYDNTTCWNNFANERRDDRCCRSCPLIPRYGEEETDRLLILADSIRIFYGRMGWGRKQQSDSADVMHLRMIHSHVLITAMSETPAGDDGYLDIDDQSFLSLGTLLIELIDHLEEHPL